MEIMLMKSYSVNYLNAVKNIWYCKDNLFLLHVLIFISFSIV